MASRFTLPVLFGITAAALQGLDDGGGGFVPADYHQASLAAVFAACFFLRALLTSDAFVGSWTRSTRKELQL